MTILNQEEPAHAAAAGRLQAEPIIWLTTVAKSGTPAPKPVWYLWHDGQILVSSQPRTAKVQHVA